MILVKLRLRGLGEIPQTEWVEVAAGLNLLEAQNTAQQRALVDALATINPPYQCREVEPFGDLPRQISRQGRTRRIVPHKRTIAIGVFNSNPDLVQELAKISPVLYETDLIEVGRRLDYSRWINFIELASSTRWSEIAAEVDALLTTGGLDPGSAGQLRRLTETLAPTDRIKGELMTELAACLEAATTGAATDERDRLIDLLHRVLRARHFTKARAVVEKRLPLLAALDLGRLRSWRLRRLSSGPQACLPPALSLLIETFERTLHASNATAANQLLHRLQRELDRQGATPTLRVQRHQQMLTVEIIAADGRQRPVDESTPLERFTVCCRLLVALSTVLLGNRPILLLSLPSRENTPEDHDGLTGRITELADSCQCLCVSTGTHLFSEIEAIPVSNSPPS